MEKVKNVRVSEVKSDAQWGLYMWRLPSGKLFSDGNGNYLNIPSMYGDIEKISIIRKAAAHYGQPEGTPHFEPGVQRATDEEYAEQVDRLKAGEIPSLNDIGAVSDAKRGLQKYGEDA
jgi:hypothetical protein